MIQNGDAPGPDDTSDVNGYDCATQINYVNFYDALRAIFD